MISFGEVVESNYFIGHGKLCIKTGPGSPCCPANAIEFITGNKQFYRDGDPVNINFHIKTNEENLPHFKDKFKDDNLKVDNRLQVLYQTSGMVLVQEDRFITYEISDKSWLIYFGMAYEEEKPYYELWEEQEWWSKIEITR